MQVFVVANGSIASDRVAGCTFVRIRGLDIILRKHVGRELLFVYRKVVDFRRRRRGFVRVGHFYLVVSLDALNDVEMRSRLILTNVDRLNL